VETVCSDLGLDRFWYEFDTLWQALGRSDPPSQQKSKLAALAAGRSRLLISEENIIGRFKDLMNGSNQAMIDPKALGRLSPPGAVRRAQSGAYHPGRAGTAIIMRLSTINC